MTARYLYHWTTALALPSIAEGGLDPSYATGKRKVVWMASEAKAMWACAHAAMHQKVSPDMMVCIRVRTDHLELMRTAWDGVKVSPVVISPSRLTLVEVKLARTGRALSLLRATQKH